MPSFKFIFKSPSEILIPGILPYNFLMRISFLSAKNSKFVFVISKLLNKSIFKFFIFPLAMKSFNNPSLLKKFLFRKLIFHL